MIIPNGPVARATTRGGYRPRLAGAGDASGGLARPALEDVRVTDSGAVLSLPGALLADPFERDQAGLFLAESFARLDLDHPRHVRSWIAAHGAPALAGLGPFATSEGSGQRRARLDRRPSAVFYMDARADIDREQRQVRWFLETLARVTEQVDRNRWAVPADPAAWLPPESQLPEARRDYVERERAAAVRWPGRGGLSWERWLELLTAVMEPYIRAALRGELHLGWDTQGRELTGKRHATVPRAWHRLVIKSPESAWDSVLCPIYLQLYEALRRVSEGLVSARFCLECSRPFLLLDARRRRFCTAPERNRFNQRRFRERREPISE